jgi:molybdenum cofactor biosynthesis enzyme MoaA
MFSKKAQIPASVPDEILQKYFHSISNEKIICRAPFTSLYFNPDGEVGACCLNKGSYYYGKYPEQSIKEILNLVPRKLHQKYVGSNNFLIGCEICNNNLLIENFEGLLANGYKFQEIKKNITRIDFELSHKCNYNCIMCEQNKHSNGEIYNSSFLSEIKPLLNNLRYANFIGGEPFLINIYYEIWEYLLQNNKNCLINVQTNGSIYNEKIKNLLQNDNFITVLSLDSIDTETYSKIRQGGNLNEVLKNFMIFNDSMKRKSHTMQISVCPLRSNRFEIPEIVRFANDNNCKIFFNQVEKPENLSLKNIPEKILSEIIEIYQKCIDSLPSTSDTEIINKNALIGLVNLLTHWKSQVIIQESESVIIKRQTIIDLFSHKEIEKYKSITDEIINRIPEFITVSKQRSIEILDLNFADKIAYLEKSGLTNQEIVKLATNFFELTRTENL